MYEDCNFNFFYNTLDIDTNERELVNRIIGKILKCDSLSDFEMQPSLQKGVHIKLFCVKKCEMCRLVFDDTIRFAYDQYRPIHSQNVMFDKKEFFKSRNKLGGEKNVS